MSHLEAIVKRMRSLAGPALLVAACLAPIGSLPASGAAGTDAALRKAVESQGPRFVEAVNSGDAALRARTLQEICTPSALENGGDQKMLRLLDRLHTDLGVLEFHHAEMISGGDDASRRYSLHVYARSGKEGGWRDLQFMLDPTPPHRIQNLVFLASVSEPVYLPNGAIENAATLEWLGRYVDKLVSDDDLSGGILLAAGDKVLFQRTFGFADSARRWPIRPNTRFNLASGGKMFTALAVAQLVGERRLGFGDTLARRLPEVSNLEFGRTVTLSQLLTHTSGIGEFWTDDYEKHWHEIKTLRQYLPFILAAGTDAKPGERFEYCNSNYILAGLVLENVTGESYDDVIAKRIFGPLGMRDTGLFPLDRRDSLQATALTGKPHAWRVADLGYRGSSAGGCMSTLSDMLRFARGLAGGKIVPDSMLTVMTTSKTEGIPGRTHITYGYGFEPQRSAGGVRSYGHGGIASGVNFEFRYFPEGDLTLIVFSNQDNGAYDDLRRNATRLITGDR